MNFSKLKLVSEMYVQQPGGGAGSLSGTKLSQAANNKASEQSQAPKGMTNTSNNIGMQQNQMSQKQGNVKAATVQKTGGAPQKVATSSAPGAIVSHYDYFNALRSKKEYNKLMEREKVNWKKELTEALGVDDEVFHPYVEVMPFKDFKQNEAKKNLAKQAMEPGAAENPAQKKVKKDMLAPVMGEETLIEGKKPKKGQAKEGKEKSKKKKLTRNLSSAYLKKYGKRLRKGSKILKDSKQEADKHANDAKNYYKKGTAALKKGDEAKHREYASKGVEASQKARAARAKGMSYIPVGSNTYSSKSHPTRMNSRFSQDMQSDAGRKRIVARSIPAGDE